MLSRTWESETSKDVAVNSAHLGIIANHFFTGCFVYYLNALQAESFKWRYPSLIK